MTDFNVECDNCGQLFMLESNRVGAEMVESIGYAHYFDCPYCGFKFVYMIEDAEQSRYLADLDIIQQRIDAKHKMNKEASAFLSKRFQKLLDKSTKHQAILRDKYQKVVTDQLNQSDLETNS